MSSFRTRISDGHFGRKIELERIPDHLMGHNAEFSLRVKVDVSLSNGVDSSSSLFERTLRIQSPEASFDAPEFPPTLYAYRGDSIHMQVVGRLKVDDSILFDTELESPIDQPVRELPKTAKAQATREINPSDTYSLAANLRALSAKDRLIVQLLLFFGSLLCLGNAALGVRDEFAAESDIVFYDHRGSDGSESPVMKSLAGSGGLGITLYAIIQVMLRRYMRFELKPGVSTPRRGNNPLARDLVTGTPRVPLEQVTVRVVAANRELGQVRRKSGKETKTESFRTPVHAVVVYEQFIPYVEAGSDIAEHLEGVVDFTPIFEQLLPPQKAGDHHGIDVVWEVQLIHPEFVDQELEGPADFVADDWARAS